MRFDPKSSDAEARKVASSGGPLKPGWYKAPITDAADKLTRWGNEMIELTHLITAPDGTERTIRAWLTGSDRNAALLRRACLAINALPRYETGEISAADFPGHTVRVKIGIQKGTRAFPGDRNFVEDYAPIGEVVTLRTAQGGE